MTSQTPREIIARAIERHFEDMNQCLGDDVATADAILSALAEQGIELVEKPVKRWLDNY